MQYEDNKALGHAATVMAGHSGPKDGGAYACLCPAIHVLVSKSKTWMPATSAGMTSDGLWPHKKAPVETGA